MVKVEALPLLLEHVPGTRHRYKVSRGGRFLGWIERVDGWWYVDGVDREPLWNRYRLRREALTALERGTDARSE